MLRMIKAELYKLFKSTTFKVLCSVAILFVILNVAAPLVMNEDFIEQSTGMTVDQYETMMANYTDDDAIVVPGQIGVQMTGAENDFDIKPYEVFHMAFGAGVMEILMAVLLGTMVAKEYSEGTIKNTLAYGKKRSHYYLSKYVANLIGMTILMSIMTILSTVVLTLIKGWGKPFELSQLLGMGETLIGAIIVFGATLAIIMLISTLVKSNGATIGIAVAIFVLIPSLVGFLYGNYDLFDTIYEGTLFYNTALVTAIKATSADILRATTIGIVWLVVALAAGIAVFNRQEIK